MTKPRFILAPGGEVQIDRLLDGSYAMDTLQHVEVAGQKAVARGVAIIRRNEAGFAGRQWEVESAAVGGAEDRQWIGSQHATIKDAALVLARMAATTASIRAALRAQKGS